MADAQIAQAAIEVFTAYYHQLEDGVTGFIAEDSIEPLVAPDLLSDISIGEEQAAEALAGTVMIKLNGGLGTSMGMERAKSLLPVRDGRTFLDLIVDQVRAARARYGAAPAARSLGKSSRTIVSVRCGASDAGAESAVWSSASAFSSPMSRTSKWRRWLALSTR